MDEYKKLLSEFVAFQTVSTDSAYKLEIEKNVAWLKDLFNKYGFRVEIWRGEIGNPVIFATYFLPVRRQRQETILVYGHYDVQPVDISDGWKGDPWKVREDPPSREASEGRLVARGIIDNKGQILIHIYTVLKLIKEGKLKYNVKFLIEGDEETGAGPLSDLILKNKKKLASDHVIISDGEIVGDVPTIEVSLRGGFNCTLQYTTASTSVHSGTYGGAIPNAAFEMAKILNRLFDSKNRVTIPGFYDDADKVTLNQLEDNKKLGRVSGDLLKQIGVRKLLAEEGLDFYTQTGLRPTLQVTGVKSGYISEGFANIVPATAEARINFRLVSSQNPDKVYKQFEKYIKSNTPKYVDWKLSIHGPHYPVKVDVSSKKVDEVRKLLRLSHGVNPLHRYVGGAIPVVTDFKTILSAETLLVPLCNEDCNMHGVEENFKIDLLKKGLDFSQRFFSI